MQNNQKTIIDDLSKLGSLIINKLINNELEELFYKIQSENNWFTAENCKLSLANIANEFLNFKKLEEFCQSYSFIENKNSKKIGIICAGNIPAVGFQDLVYTLLNGDTALLKLSTTDSVLMIFLIEQLILINQNLKESIFIVDRLNNADAFIATGSDNSSRYFEYYFKAKPHLLRKNRSSVAILENGLTTKDYVNLGKDIFQFYGLGCRNISKFYVPENFDFVPFFESIEIYESVFFHHKYKNNYDYNKSILLINQNKFYDNGFLSLKEEEALVSPISVIHYETYQDKTSLAEKLNKLSEKIQCISCLTPTQSNEVCFGDTQIPSLYNFADNIDVISFLQKI